MLRYFLIILLILLIIYGLYQFKNDNFLADNQGVVDVSYIKPSNPEKGFQINKKAPFKCDDDGKCTIELFALPSLSSQPPTQTPVSTQSSTQSSTQLSTQSSSVSINPKISEIQNKLIEYEANLDKITDKLNSVLNKYNGLKNNYIFTHITQTNDIINTLQSDNFLNYSLPNYTKPENIS